MPRLPVVLIFLLVLSFGAVGCSHRAGEGRLMVEKPSDFAVGMRFTEESSLGMIESMRRWDLYAFETPSAYYALGEGGSSYEALAVAIAAEGARQLLARFMTRTPAPTFEQVLARIEETGTGRIYGEPVTETTRGNEGRVLSYHVTVVVRIEKPFYIPLR